MLRLIGLGTVVYFGWTSGVIQFGLRVVANVLRFIASC